MQEHVDAAMKGQTRGARKRPAGPSAAAASLATDLELFRAEVQSSTTWPSWQDLGVTTLFLTVGLPGAGKTTRARHLAIEHSALRLTPDEWMIPLFGDPQPDGKRDVLEGRLLWLGLEALRLGTNVVLDFGCWSRDERSAIRWLVMSVGASCQLVYVPVDHETQRARIAHRQSTTPDQTFAMSERDLLHWRTLFEEPDVTELDGHGVGGAPPGWSGWLEWAADRWPSLV